ncbi:MAG TPA: nucleoside kinase [Chloroflexi bacterium]|nr:nucleoside kinase [Chloroflexota bacterium]
MNHTNKVWQTEPRETVQSWLADGRTFEAPKGTTLKAFFEAAYPDPPVPVIAALVGGVLRELTWELAQDSRVKPIFLSESDGVRIYRRSLTFLLIAAAHRLFPDVEVYIDHSLPFGAFFCEAANREPFSPAELDAITAEMHRLVAADLPIVREELPLDEALALFEERGVMDKVHLFQSRIRNQRMHLRLYNLDGYRDYFHGYMVPSTGYLRYFELLPWGEEGFILRFPRRHEPTQLQEVQDSPQLLQVFREYGSWLRLLRVENVAGLNEAIAADRLRQIVLVSEALHERKIADIARQIQCQREKVRLVLIAGPSSSGKTTFSRRLAVQLLAHGLHPFALEMDNYFVERELTPRDEHGEYDFEALEALDLARLNADLNALLAGEEVQLPRFNFRTGHREVGERVKLRPEHIIILEGIHGLNPALVQAVPESCTYRIYVSALTQLNLDRHNRVPTTDTRLIRRIVRDARTRGYNAEETLARWQSVRRGEKRYIFPYQENADVMFNSALAYEMAMLKPLAEPLLLQVRPESPQSVEAKRLLTFLQWFTPASADNTPENSILREFVGGQALDGFHWD